MSQKYQITRDCPDAHTRSLSQPIIHLYVDEYWQTGSVQLLSEREFGSKISGLPLLRLLHFMARMTSMMLAYWSPYAYKRRFSIIMAG